MQKRILAHTSEVEKERKGYIIHHLEKDSMDACGATQALSSLSCLKLEALKIRSYGHGLFGSASLLSGSGSDIS